MKRITIFAAVYLISFLLLTSELSPGNRYVKISPTVEKQNVLIFDQTDKCPYLELLIIRSRAEVQNSMGKCPFLEYMRSTSGDKCPYKENKSNSGTLERFKKHKIKNVKIT